MFTILTSEQQAVLEACEERYDKVGAYQFAEQPPVTVDVQINGQTQTLVILGDGTTRCYGPGTMLVPERLYGVLPNNDDKRKDWGKGLPKYAKVEK
jgi:hypothetical protein